MACGGIETACWELEARRAGVPLWKHIGGTYPEIACGVSIGIKKTVEELVETVAKEVAAGYQRGKGKIKPGWDLKPLAAIRPGLPSIPPVAHADSPYTPPAVEQL